MNVPLPSGFLDSLEGLPGFDRVSFEEVHRGEEKSVSIRMNPLKWNPTGRLSEAPPLGYDTSLLLPAFRNMYPVPWSSTGYYLPERPLFTMDPLLHAGLYYVQEASSMFLEQALKQSIDISRNLRVLDLCAAPGGKSTLIQSFLSPDSVLLSNELIKSRVAILQENMIKWGGGNGVISNQDPAAFSRMKDYFDLMVVDAPCSGSGLFRREPEAILQWSEENVKACQFRQQRILADAWPSLKKGGILIYSTCSYSAAENEEILDWIADRFQVESLSLAIDPGWHIAETVSPLHQISGYRFYPDKLQGEGFFIACLRKREGEENSGFRFPKGKGEFLHRKELGLIHEMVRDDIPLAFLKINEMVYAIPDSWKQEMDFLRKSLYLKKLGVLIGKMTPKGLIPDHELALSNLVRRDLERLSLSREEAILYLRKEPIVISGHSKKGWTLVQYGAHNLGWMKMLGNRENNYYPVEWRIRSRSNQGTEKPGMYGESGNQAKDY